MDWRGRLPRLTTPLSRFGWLSLMTALWGAIGQYDTALGIPNVLQNIWSWVSSPWGFFPLFVLGLGVIILAVWQPPFIWKGRSPKFSAEALADKLAGFEGIPSQLQDHERRLTNISEQLERLKVSNGPHLNLNTDAIRRSISINYLPSDPDFIVEEVGSIQRRLVFRFTVSHFSPNVRIELTYNVNGSLVAYDSRQNALKWSVWCPDPKLLSVGDNLIFHVDYPITERFAETLAFKANYNDRTIDLHFSEMEVEFRAHSLDGIAGLVVGFVGLGVVKPVPIADHVAFKSIRDAYNRLHSPGLL